MEQLLVYLRLEVFGSKAAMLLTISYQSSAQKTPKIKCSVTKDRLHKKWFGLIL